MYKIIKDIINNNNINDFTYIEPFSGGCGLGIKLLLKGEAKKLVINDLDYSIYSFWYSILNHTEEFCELITNTPINIDEWHKQKDILFNYKNRSILELGFATFFLNRTNRSGILKAGPIGGYNQDGNYLIDCRFNKKDLIKKIKEITKYKNNIELYNLDAVDLILENISNRNDTIFINFDPPYVSKGNELYVNFYTEDDHKKLAKIISNNLENKHWIITYDNHDLIKEIYKEYTIVEFALRYSVQSKRIASELLIVNNTIKLD